MGLSRLKRLTHHFHRHDKKDESTSKLDEGASQSPGSSITQADTSSKDSKNATHEPSEPKDDHPKSRAIGETTSLWDRAYSKLQESDPKLVQKFEKLAAHELEETYVENDNGDQETLDPHGAGQAKMMTLITRGLEKTAAVAEAKAGAKSTVDFILHFKDAIDSAMQASPAPAAVWTGVSLGLNLFLEPLQATETNRAGIVYVVARIKWYDSLSNLLLQENTTMDTPRFGSLRSSLEDKLLGLYKDITKFTTLSVLSYYRNQGLQFLRDFAGIDSLATSLQAIKDEEEMVLKDIEQFGSQAIQSHLSNLVAAADYQQRELNSRLVNIETAIERQTAAQKKWHVEDGDDDCLKDLWVTSPEIEMQAIESRKDELIDEAYEWVLETEAYKSIFNWDNDSQAEPEKRLLWIRGDAGTGKTMTTMGIVRDLQSAMQRHQDAVLSYFFVQATDDRLNNATAILRTLVWFLAKQKRHLVSYLREHHKTANDIFSGTHAFFLLSQILQNMAQDEALSRFVLLIDALDECQDIGLKDLMETVGIILKKCPRVRIVLSSRPENPWIESNLQQVAPLMATLQLSPILLAQPVEVYIQRRTTRLMPRFQPETVMNIAQQLRQKACGTFLWVALVCKELEDVDEYDVEEVVKEIPSGLKRLYERMFQKVKTLKRRDPEFCNSVLETITVAFRPLTLAELGTLAGLPPNVPALIIAKKCGSFLTIRDGTVYLIHQSAKDYLYDDIYHGRLGEMNATVFQRSLEGMMPTLKRDIYGVKSLGTLTTNITAPIPDPLDPIVYCCLHWADHLCEFGEGSQIATELIHSFLRTKFLNWIEALVLLHEFPRLVNSITKLRSLSKEQNPSDQFLIDFTVDAERFLDFNRAAVELAPLQVYASALIFVPSRSLMRELFKDEAPSWVSVAPIEQNWNPNIGKIKSRLTGRFIRAIASSDGRLVCHTWTRHGDETGEFTDLIEVLEPDLSTVAFQFEVSIDDSCNPGLYRNMASLPGGNIAFHADGKIRCYDHKGNLMREIEALHVKAMASSPYGDIIIDPGDGTTRILSADLQEKAVLHGGSFVALPDGCIVSGAVHGTLQLWEYPGYLQGARPIISEMLDAAERSQLGPPHYYEDEVRPAEERESPEEPISKINVPGLKSNYDLELASSPKGRVASLTRVQRDDAESIRGDTPTIIKLWHMGVVPPRGLECVATMILECQTVDSMAFLSDDRLVALVESRSTQCSELHIWNTSGDLVGYCMLPYMQLRDLIPLKGGTPRFLIGTNLFDAELVPVPQAAEVTVSSENRQLMWISPDATTVVTHLDGCETDEARIWDVTGPLPTLRRILKDVAHDRGTGTTREILLSNDGTRMAVTSRNFFREGSVVRLWDTISGEQILLPELELIYPGHDPLGTAFTWDSSTFVWISGPQWEAENFASLTVKLADLDDCLVRSFDLSIDGFGEGVARIAEIVLSPDARSLAVALCKGGPWYKQNSIGVELVDLETGARLRLHKSYSESCHVSGLHLVWSPDGKFVLARYDVRFSEYQRADVTVWEVGRADETKGWTFIIGQGNPPGSQFDISGMQADAYRETRFGWNILEALHGKLDHPLYHCGPHDGPEDDHWWLMRNGERVIYIDRLRRTHETVASSRPNVCGEGGKLIFAPRGGGLVIWSFSTAGE